MKALFVVLLAAVLAHVAPAFAQSSSASPLIGSWAVDVSRLPMPPEVRPIYTVAADGKSMVETAAYFGHDGRPIMRTNPFTRVR